MAGRANLEDEPLAWANWRAASGRARERGAFEFAWYSDIWPTGEINGELGPLLVLNRVNATQRDETVQSLVARFSTRLERPPPRQVRLRTEYSRWVGVDIGEELANLFALAFGVRCRSGGVSRVFDPRDADVRGDPVAWNLVAQEVPRPAQHAGHQLPRMSGTREGNKRQVSLNDDSALDLLRRYPKASQRKAVGLVRAARLYADGIWRADADPEAAWLLLVSACETAAATIYGSYDKLNKQRRARERAATMRFLRFLDEYSPDPPAVRPQWGRLDWSKMRESADLIYHWRSRMLHDGIPFPPSLIEPPRPDAAGVLNEIPGGLATSSGRSTWRAGHAPMLLHTFEWITRGALHNWWRKTPLR